MSSNYICIVQLTEQNDLAPVVSLREEIGMFQFGKVQFCVESLTELSGEQIVESLPIMGVPPPPLNDVIPLGTTAERPWIITRQLSYIFVERERLSSIGGLYTLH